jgi:serine phosphatase RsbU (regulator of sigma subunit)
VYHIQVAEGVEPGALAAQQLAEGEMLVQVLQEKNDAFFRYEVELNPRYRPHRTTLRQAFEAFSSEVMLPVRYKDEMLGIISLGRKKSGKMFTLEDLDLLRTVANQGAMALENAKLFREYLEKTRLDEELKIAHNIQTSMLPERAPELPGFQIAAKSIPARQVGGDFYDFIEVGGNGTGRRLAVVVGDVSGKAVSAALLMAASRSIVRVLAETNPSVKDVMSIGNQRLNKDIKKGTFVALLYAVVDVEQRALILSNAGQTQPIICSGDATKPAYIDTEGDKFPLGIVKNCQYQETQFSLKPGDTVVFYTDGVVEAMNGKQEMYGFDRLLASVEYRRKLNAPMMLEKLIDDVVQFVGDTEQHDDLTLVVLKAE